MIIENVIESEDDIVNLDMLDDVIDVIQGDIMAVIDYDNFPNSSAIAMMELARMILDDEGDFIDTAFSVAEKFDDCEYVEYDNYDTDRIVELCLSGK